MTLDSNKNLKCLSFVRIWISANRVWLLLLIILYFLTSYHAYKYLVSGFHHPNGYYHFDFGAYYNAAAVLNSTNPDLYNQEISEKIAAEISMETYYSPYVYPPFFAIILRPMALIPHRIAIWIWMIFNILLLVIIAKQFAWLIQEQEKNSEEIILPFYESYFVLFFRKRLNSGHRNIKRALNNFHKTNRLVPILFACLIFPPVYHTLILGQVNLLLLLLFLITYKYALSPSTKGQQIIAGISLGLATGIKPFILIFIPLLWFFRRRGIAMYALLSFLFTLLVGYIGTDWSTNFIYFQNTIPEVQNNLLTYDNHAVLATLQRMYIPIKFQLIDSFIQEDLPVTFTRLSGDSKQGIVYGWLIIIVVAIISARTLYIYWRSFLTDNDNSNFRNAFMLLLVALMLLMPSGWTSTSLMSLLLLPIITYSLKDHEEPLNIEFQKSMLYSSLTLMLINFIWLQIPLFTNDMLPFWILTLATIGMLILWSLYIIKPYKTSSQVNKISNNHTRSYLNNEIKDRHYQ